MQPNERRVASARTYSVATAALAIAIVLLCTEARASCNLIPQTEKSFDSVRGATTRPFAAPGEPLALRLRPCDPAGPVIDPAAANHLITVVYEPTGGGSKHAVVLTAAADCAAVAPLLAACDAALGAGGDAACVSGTSAGMQVVPRNGTNYLQFTFPDPSAVFGTALAGPATIAVTDASPVSLPCQLATQNCTQQSGLVACVDSFYTGDGTCSRTLPQGTFNRFTALPVPNDFAADCWETMPPCTLSSSQFRLTTDADGNALVPMDWRDVLVRQNQVPVPRLLSATIAHPIPVFGVHIPGKSFLGSFTPEGGALPPIFEPENDASAPDGVATLFGSADAPYTILRLARRSETFQECSGGDNDGLPCNEQTDCPSGSCGPTTCVGGSRHGAACAGDGACPGGECGPELIDLRTVGSNGNGPVVLNRTGNGVCQETPSQTCTAASQCDMGSGTCVTYALTAEYPVPLDGLAETPDVFAFSVNEVVDSVIRNADGDATDTVLILRDRDSGVALDVPGPGEGRAVVRISEAPFTSPAVATEDSIVAFLESEALQGTATSPVILNSDGDSVDSLLRVLREESNQTLAELTATISPPLAVNPEPAINHRSLAVSNGRVFFRVPEDGAVGERTHRVTIGSMGEETDNNSVALSPAHGYSSPLPAFSADGRFLVFNSKAGNLIAGGTSPGRWHVYLHDRDADMDGVFDENAQTATMLVTETAGTEANLTSDHQTISPDGNCVVFRTQSTNLVAVPGACPNAWSGTAEPNSCGHIVLYDRNSDTFELISQSSSGVAGDGDSFAPTVSWDGRFVAFESYSANLVAGDTNTCVGYPNPGQCADIFLRDRCISQGNAVPGCAPSTIRVSLSETGAQGTERSIAPSISWDGRFVAFDSKAPLASTDIDSVDAIYVRDWVAGTTELISADPFTSGAVFSIYPNISGNGRYVSFFSFAQLTAGSPGGGQIYVRDRQTGGFDLASVSSEGVAQVTGVNLPGILSYDGRFVMFYSSAPNLVANDTNTCNPGDLPGECPDYFVHDRVTGATRRVTVADDGADSDYESPWGFLSPDGRTAAFVTGASNLIGPGGDTNATCQDFDGDMNLDNCADLYIRTLDWGAAAAHDLTGDGDANDSVLAVLDTAPLAPTPIILCPAEQVSVVGGAAAFLRPESAGASTNPECTGGALTGPELNGNLSTEDLVVHFASSANSVQNLGLAADSVTLSGVCTAGSNVERACRADGECPDGACSPRYVAALVSEEGQGEDLNDDNDAVDDVPHVYSLGASPSAWSNLEVAGDSLDALGSLVAFLAPEDAQGKDLNGDRDKADRVMHVYDASSDTLVNTHVAAEEFVIGGSLGDCGNSPLVAFRTSEAAQEDTNLNGDLNTSDYVLHIYAKGLGVINTAQAVTPCRLEACDPRLPYRVYGSKVKFLTFEVEQGADLNGDNDATDLVLQVYDACKRESTVVSTLDYDSPTASTSAQLTDPLERDPDTDGEVLITPAKRCVEAGTTLLVPATCETLADCPSNATSCSDDLVVVAEGAIPKHDTVLLPIKALSVTIPTSGADVVKTVAIKVRNGDIPEADGHVVRLSVEPGDCPALTIEGAPDFDKETAGDQSTALVRSGKARSAKVRLRFKDDDFAPHNARAPQRCSLQVQATTLELGNEDPTPRNNVQAIQVDVFDKSDNASVDTHESVIAGTAAVKLTIGATATSASKNVKVKVRNADEGEGGGHSIALSVDQGDCPAGTVAVSGSSSVVVAGGSSAKMVLAVNVSNSDFAAKNGRSPGRCTANLTATTNEIGNVEPDLSNNTTRLLIEVYDKTDY